MPSSSHPLWLVRGWGVKGWCRGGGGFRVGAGKPSTPPKSQNKADRAHPSLKRLTDWVAPVGQGVVAEGLLGLASCAPRGIGNYKTTWGRHGCGAWEPL